MAEAVVVVGLRHTQIALKVKERAIHHAVVQASDEAASLLVNRAREKAPGRIKGEIFGRTTNPRRFAGDKAVTVSTVEVGIDTSLGKQGLWYEGGTGVYKRPEFGGPASSWVEVAHGGAQKFDGVYRKFTSHFGQRPRPILEEAAAELTLVIEKLYEVRVHAAVETGG